VRRLAAAIDDIRLATPVRQVRRSPSGLQVHSDAAVEPYDAVVLACHSDQALAILGDAATPAERHLLGAIRYAPNRAVLHTDRRSCRARRPSGRRGTTSRAPANWTAVRSASPI
jgi:predicted NAD/FAD-binding protein